MRLTGKFRVMGTWRRVRWRGVLQDRRDLGNPLLRRDAARDPQAIPAEAALPPFVVTKGGVNGVRGVRETAAAKKSLTGSGEDFAAISYAVRVGLPEAGAPFRHVALHVEETPRVRWVAADGVWPIT